MFYLTILKRYDVDWVGTLAIKGPLQTEVTVKALVCENKECQIKSTNISYIPSRCSGAYCITWHMKIFKGHMKWLSVGSLALLDETTYLCFYLSHFLKTVIFYSLSKSREIQLAFFLANSFESLVTCMRIEHFFSHRHFGYQILALWVPPPPTRPPPHTHTRVCW